MFLVVMVVAQPLQAQMLKFGAATSPPGGNRFALIQSTTQLEESIKTLEKDAATDTGDGSRQRVRTRRFVLALLQRAAELKDDGAHHVVAGMTLVQTIDSLDALGVLLASGPKERASRYTGLLMKLPHSKADIPGTAAELDDALGEWLGPIAAMHASVVTTSGKVDAWARSPGRVGWISERHQDAVAAINILLERSELRPGGAMLI
ncbi:MAG: hypothetical protein H7210_02985, partial [Pyrinomonadaceae bacterium]|nr:hypothetical protein [Phycisphaerales bacterium]